ncbi:DUF2397 family protein [Glycomyces sp. YM15]|uniref:DUF2397 family protein n=1 Tax=Glycomyces sp. YM15 TaxID=2800446 RepID=UPI0019637061|nr:DUF2397 family protein [Glycomyces sp. YM15]
MTDSPTYAFGLDAVGLDDRMRLFSFITAPERHDYLWVLRAIDRARANYQVVLSTEAVSQALDELAERDSSCPGGGEVDLAARLDALDDWGVLDRTQDAARAATIAEYRRRHSVYQFTEAGHRAFTAVESVLGATMEETSLSRIVFRDLLEDLEQLATANRSGDGDTGSRASRRPPPCPRRTSRHRRRFSSIGRNPSDSRLLGAASTARLLRRADFDWAGLRIVKRGLERFANAEPWRMSAEDYRSGAKDIALRGSGVETPWDHRLGECMAAEGRAVMEESLIGLLLQDLRRG